MPHIAAGGHSLEYVEFEGAEPALVFLHEGLGSIRQWREFPESVAQATRRRVIVYNRYGYGNSDVLQEPRVGVRYLHDEALRVLPELLGRLGAHRPVLVGHSDGASIALIYAGAGHEASGLVVMAPHVFVEDVSIRSIEQAKVAFETTDMAERLARSHRDARRTFYLWNDVWLDPEFRAWNIEQYLPGIRCPLLAIQGEDDEYGTVAQLDSIRATVPGRCEVVMLPACGHRVHRDQPEAALAALVRFVRELA
jgi:pimeloyl-ACP methyl ester carboxylesterase